jgi:hypothetical protein
MQYGYLVSTVRDANGAALLEFSIFVQETATGKPMQFDADGSVACSIERLHDAHA